MKTLVKTLPKRNLRKVGFLRQFSRISFLSPNKLANENNFLFVSSNKTFVDRFSLIPL